MNKNIFSTRNILISSMIAAVYVVLTLINPFSWGPIQCRVSEALTVLPIFFPQSILGLFVGCVISNIIGGFGIVDVVVGSLTTLIAAIITYRLRKNYLLAMLSPVVLNGVAIGLMLHLIIPNTPLFYTMLTVAIGEAIAVYPLGYILIKSIEKTDIVNKINK